ncbi:MAG TPA: hypothetical protein VJB89_00680 [Candidatus Nanoarchaeia archaeon]|nr:hypothetical protein [Candidatus Nanoarchaeia archaeon]
MSQCIKCKGNLKCGKPICQIIAKSESRIKIKELLKENLDSISPPTVFIGSKLQYPKVNVGILSPIKVEQEPSIYDNPYYWYKNKFNIQQVINLRTSLVNSRFQTTVKEIRNPKKFLELAQEIGMSLKPAEVEINIKHINKQIRLDDISLPMGPSASLESLKVNSNIKIPQKVDKVYSDTDLKAAEALKYLYKNNFNEQNLTQILSIGCLGLKKNRILVPTRNSITAVDDTIGKELITNIKEFKTIDNYQLFIGNYFGNYFYILLFPEVWSYELFELYSNSIWNLNELEMITDHETYKGRTSYAENCAGGFYAARISLLEYLNSIKKQATAILIRFITPEYSNPLGVFIVRQAVRNSFEQTPIQFDSKEKLMDFTNSKLKEEFNFELNNITKNSVLINQLKSQTKLNWF